MRKYIIRGTFPSKANNYKPIVVRGKKRTYARMIKNEKVKHFESIMRMQLDQIIPVKGRFIAIGVIYAKTDLKDLDGFLKLFYDILQDEGKIENDRLLAHHSWSKELDEEDPRVEFYLLSRGEYKVNVSVESANK